MIKTEIVTIEETQFKYTCSDTYMIRKVGTDEVYAEAYDVMETEFEYEETDEPLPVYEPIDIPIEEPQEL